MKQSNNLKYSATKTVGKETITVSIRLNDECKNGHQDFSITGDIYKAGAPRTDRNFISGGCIHDDISRHFPEFYPFIKLHLCDYAGVPMHCVANGFYHLTHGFNSKSAGRAFMLEYCDYYRINEAQFYILSTCKNEVQYNQKLISEGILTQWKLEADAAIKQLETLTGETFVNDSKRSQYIPPTQEAIAQEEERQANGYYTPEAEAKRAEDKKASILQGLANDLQKAIAKHTLEFEAKKEVFLKGGEKALKCCIFYNHTKELSFNWNSAETLPVEVINNLIPTLNLPEGVTANISENK